jgi:PAS domain S-box-containing protein
MITRPLTSEAVAALQILLLETSSDDAQRVVEAVRSAGFVVEPTIVSNRLEFLEAISSGNFSAIFSAFQLPDWDAMQALQELRRAGKNAPFILVTGALDEEAAVECVKHGVDGYVLKSHLARLPTVLRRVLDEKRSREEKGIPQDNEELLIENAVYGTFRVSLDGEFLTANPVLLKILAYPSLQLLQDRKLSEVFRFPEHYVKLFTACRLNSAVHSVETEWCRRDGGFLCVKLHLRCVSGNGVGRELEGMVEDITELRALEHQLQQAQKFETIGQLARGVAHDFNNVIGAILGWAELGLEECQRQPQIADRFTRIRAQAERAASLTRELLAIGRRQSLQSQSIDLDPIIRNLGVFLGKVIDSDIEIKLIARALKPIYADASKIEQVFLNICLNARDAMPNGGYLTMESDMVQLDESFCRLYPDVSPGHYAVVSIADTGIGMSAEIRDRIFEPFFTTKARGVGSGMGLATAYGIVKQHGGFIHVYSEVGHGSLFRVYLPAVVEVVAVTPSQTAESSASSKPQGCETLLLAEDHDSIHETVRQSLAGLGYQVLSAGNGEEALQLCRQQTPALAILDLVMPHMGGAAAAIQLRERFPDLPILFTSGYAETQNSVSSHFSNSSYLQKPYSPTALAQTIRKILDPPSV